ncbi:MAG: type II secretion system protein GspN [Myxococcota bacterium]|nr:type II secretion system protein GspN [Myxococcota bacterium]
MNERLLKYARYVNVVSYPLFYIACLLIFASLTFPYSKLRDHVVASFNAQQRATGGQQELQIDQMSGYWLSGVRMKGVRLFIDSGESGQPPQKIEVDSVTVRYGILSSLFGSSDMSFDVMALGGEASGSYGTHGKDLALEVTIDGMDVGRFEPLVGILGVPLQGKLGGAVKLAMPDGRASKGSGSVSLEVKDTAVGDGKAKFKGALALPPINVGTITLAAEAKDGTLKITKFVAGGKDVDLQGEGRIVMRELATDSLSDAQVRFKINDAYRAKNDVTRSLFGAPGSSAPPLIELADPRVKQSKRADGFYVWTIRGTIARPELLPAGGGGAVGAGPPIMMVPPGAP